MASKRITTFGLVWQLARHELLIAFKSRRIMGVLVLYSALALIGSYVYVAFLKAIEAQSIKFLINSGVDSAQANETVSVMGSEAYQKVLAFFVGAQPEDLSAALMSSPFMPVILWASLTFLPYLILLLAYDIIINDVESRTLCYSLLRASRAQLVFGKYLAHTLIFMGLNTVCSVLLVTMSLQLIGTADASQTVMGLLRVWLSLIPYGLCYLGMFFFVSSMMRRRGGTLTFAIVTMSVFQGISWTRYLPSEGVWGALQYLHWLSPSNYIDGLWLSGMTQPLTSVGALLCFASGFIMLAIWRLKGRDL